MGHFVVDVPGATYWMNTLANVTAPAPGDDGALDWAAWPVDFVIGEPHCDYIARVETTGGECALGVTQAGGWRLVRRRRL